MKKNSKPGLEKNYFAFFRKNTFPKPRFFSYRWGAKEILADLWQLNTDIADTLPTPRESASHTSERQICPSGLGLMSSNQEKAMTGVGDNDTSVAESADAGVPGGWWEANEVVTLTTVCYIPVAKAAISGISGDKYDRTYKKAKRTYYSRNWV